MKTVPGFVNKLPMLQLFILLHDIVLLNFNKTEVLGIFRMLALKALYSKVMRKLRIRIVVPIRN